MDDSRPDRPSCFDEPSADIAPENPRAKMLWELAALIAAEDKPELLFDRAAELICVGIADSCVVGVLSDVDNRIHPLGLYHRDAARRGELDSLSELAWSPEEEVTRQVLDTGGPLLVSFEVGSPSQKPLWAGAFLNERGTHGALLVGMHAMGTAVGVLAMARNRPHRQFDEDDLPFAQEVAGRLALAVRVMQLEELAEHGTEESRTGSDQGRLALLSAREREVFRFIGEGLTSREVGEHLFLSVRTVEWHRARLMAKLGVSSRSELIALARSLRP